MDTQIITTFTDEQRKTFTDCEKVLNENESAFLASIRALKTISDGQLYRIKGFDTFEAFLAARQVKIARGAKRAAQLIRHVGIVDTLAQQPGITVLPDNERQTRELKFSDPVELAAAWLGAQTASGEDQPSGSWVKSSVQTLTEAKVMESVDLNRGVNAPVTAENVTESTIIKEGERIQRMRDNVKAARARSKRSKPAAVFEGTFEESYKDDDPALGFTFIGHTAEQIAALMAGKCYRFVVYEIPVEVQA